MRYTDIYVLKSIEIYIWDLNLLFDNIYHILIYL